MSHISNRSTISNNSTIITSGIGTSTPISDNFSQSLDSYCYRQNFNDPNRQAKKKLKFLHPNVQYAEVPIFGRRNLQLLSDREYEREYEYASTIASQSRFSPTLAGDTLINTVEIGGKCRKPGVESISDRLQSSRQIINVDSSFVRFKKDVAIIKNKIWARRSVTSKDACSSAIKSTSSQSNPSFKICPKIRKSPRNLQAIPGKAKKRHERNSIQIKGKDKSSDNNNNEVNIITVCPKTLVVQRLNKSDKENAKIRKPVLLSTSNIRKRTENKKSECKSSSLLKCAQRLKDKENKDLDLEKLVVFKAGPIKSCSGVPIVKKRRITVPVSPKLGRGVRIHKCQR